MATEPADLAGGPEQLAWRAEGLCESGEIALACHLIDLAAAADPTSERVHAIRADIYWQRRADEQSLMGAAIFESTARESAAVAGTDLPQDVRP